ncbi:PhnE/PtxC family ABC transporter permease [Salinicola acroporae]|uniref:PhnE/PtxC family ABC transporter permease n=1 Tax=Salinicola acroporae TaxID=1541440 RepID=UPI002459027B|nr:hypothetical protein [Salinicola acroporae]
MGALYPRERWKRFLTLLVVAAAVVWAVESIDIIWPWVWDAPAQVGDLFGRMVPPDVSNLQAILWALVETLNIATIATFVAVFLSLPIAYIAAQNTTPTASRYGWGVSSWSRAGRSIR